MTKQYLQSSRLYFSGAIFAAAEKHRQHYPYGVSHTQFEQYFEAMDLVCGYHVRALYAVTNKEW
jgi:hypothetical protein